MALKSKRDLYFAALLLLVPVAGALLGAFLPAQTSGYAPAGVDNLDDLLALTDAHSQSEAFLMAQAEGVRGAPLGAAPPPAPPAGQPGAPGHHMPSPDNPNLIPQASWDLLNQVQKPPESEEDRYRFDRTADGKYLKVTFSALGGYEYKLPDPEVVRNSADPTKPPTQQIPDELMAIDGEDVVLVGFMVPFDIDRRGNVKSFALTVNQAFCCFGIPPAMNELVMVTMEEGKVAPFLNNIPLAAYGKLEVGEEIDEGYVLSVYRMTATEVIDVKELLRRSQPGGGN